MYLTKFLWHLLKFRARGMYLTSLTLILVLSLPDLEFDGSVKGLGGNVLVGIMRQEKCFSGPTVGKSVGLVLHSPLHPPQGVSHLHRLRVRDNGFQPWHAGNTLTKRHGRRRAKAATWLAPAVPSGKGTPGIAGPSGPTGMARQGMLPFKRTVRPPLIHPPNRKTRVHAGKKV